MKLGVQVFVNGGILAQTTTVANWDELLDVVGAYHKNFPGCTITVAHRA